MIIFLVYIISLMRTYLVVPKRPVRLVRVSALALFVGSFMAIATVMGARDTFAQSAASAPANIAAAAADPARDATMKTYLQKHFKIASPDLIKFGPAVQTSIPGLLGRQMTVSNVEGQSVNTALFFDKSGTKMIIGSFIDTNVEPWGRVNLGGIHLNDNPTMGPADAPITVVEFADFECPFCARAFSVLETMANTTYKDKMRVIFKNYPLNVHPWAVKAAAAAECARLQNPNAFWDFARYFYTNQGSIKPKNVQEHVDKEAANLKLDGPSLKACMGSAAASDRVKQDQADGNSIHVNSTPTFFINGIPVVGLPDNKVLEFVINSELAEKSASAKH
jgi:protein-disulfide isomerase